MFTVEFVLFEFFFLTSRLLNLISPFLVFCAIFYTTTVKNATVDNEYPEDNEYLKGRR